MRPALAPVVLLLALTTAGCGITNPYTTTTTTASTSTSTTNPEPPQEQNGTIPTNAQAAQNKLAPGAARSTPQAALEHYATLYINWTAQTVAQNQRQLASISLAGARAQALQAAASYAKDTTLQASQVANTGSILSIAPGQGPAAGDWIVVTRETTTGTGNYVGLPPTDHVTIAQLQHTTTGGWVISSWNPQS